MSHQIIIRSDKLYAIFSSIVDDLIVTKTTREELIAFYKEEGGR